MHKKWSLYLLFTTCLILHVYLLKHPLPFQFLPWITLQVYLAKKLSFTNGLNAHFLLGLFYSIQQSEFRLGVFSLILVINLALLRNLRRSFIDEQPLALSIYAALFGMLFSISEFLIHQIFISTYKMSASSVVTEITLKFFSDWCGSLAIFSWMAFVNFFVILSKKLYLKLHTKLMERAYGKPT